MLLESKLLFTPKLFLLGLSSFKLPKLQNKLLRRDTMAARCLFTLNWKKRECLYQAALYMRIKDVELMELFTTSPNNSVEKHNVIWQV